MSKKIAETMIYYTTLLSRFPESFASLASFYNLKAVRQNSSEP